MSLVAGTKNLLEIIKSKFEKSNEELKYELNQKNPAISKWNYY